MYKKFRWSNPGLYIEAILSRCSISIFLESVKDGKIFRRFQGAFLYPQNIGLKWINNENNYNWVRSNYLTHPFCRFSMPATSQTYKAKRNESRSLQKEDVYTLKEYQRVIEVGRYMLYRKIWYGEELNFESNDASKK